MKNCGKCGQLAPVTAKVGDVCPYCGARWDFEQTTYVPAPKSESRLLHLLAWAILIAAVLLTLLIPFFLRHKP
jgi:hypothetical protein